MRVIAAADESAYTVKDCTERIEHGHKAIVLKAIAKNSQHEFKESPPCIREKCTLALCGPDGEPYTGRLEQERRG